MPGPKPQPAEIKALKGNPGRRPLAPAPADLGLFSSEPPKSLKRKPKAVWKHFAEAWRGLRFIRASDEPALERYCHDLAAWRDVTDRLEKVDGNIYETKSTHGTMLRVHPYFLVQDRLAKRLEAFEDRFGLNPASRQRIMLGMAAQAGGGPKLPLDEPGAEKPAPPAGSPIGMLTEHSPVGGSS